LIRYGEFFGDEETISILEGYRAVVEHFVYILKLPKKDAT